jgi:hypothetical protein
MLTDPEYKIITYHINIYAKDVMLVSKYISEIHYGIYLLCNGNGYAKSISD